VRVATLTISLLVALASYTVWGTYVSESPWWEIVESLLLGPRAPWFDPDDKLGHIVSALVFWASIAVFAFGVTVRAFTRGSA
jgi:hypothetical protein